MKDDWNSSYDLRDFLMANIRISAENANRLAPEAWNRIEKYFNAKHRKNMDAANERHAKEIAELTARIEQLSTPSGAFKEHLRRTLMDDKDFLAELVRQIAVDHLGLDERDTSDYGAPYRGTYYLQWDGKDI